MSDTPDPESPAQGDEYQWRDGEIEVVLYTLDGMVATSVIYPTVQHFADTVTQEQVTSSGINEDVKTLPSADWFADLDLPEDE